jgi:hypothetical protein
MFFLKNSDFLLFTKREFWSQKLDKIFFILIYKLEKPDKIEVLGKHELAIFSYFLNGLEKIIII